MSAFDPKRTSIDPFRYATLNRYDAVTEVSECDDEATRALVFRDPTSAAGIGQFAAVQSVSQSLGVELTPVNVRNNLTIPQSTPRHCRRGHRVGVISAIGP